MKITIVHQLPPELLDLLRDINSGLQTLKSGVAQMVKTMDDVLAELEAEHEVINSAVVLLNNLSQMLKDALATGDPAKVQAVIDKIDANKADLAAGVAANTPGAPNP